MDTRKEAICNALAAFIRQRPGLDPRNYFSTYSDTAGRQAYFSEKRSIERDKRDAERLLDAVRRTDGISADALLAASRDAFSGRLSVEVRDDWRIAIEASPRAKRPEAWVTGFKSQGDAEALIALWRASGSDQADRAWVSPPTGAARIDYCTGQYWPTEYRRAVAAVCASALWAWQRENMPAPRDYPVGADGRKCWYDSPSDHAGTYVQAGDWLRRKFRQDFGSALQKRYFD